MSDLDERSALEWAEIARVLRLADGEDIAAGQPGVVLGDAATGTRLFQLPHRLLELRPDGSVYDSRNEANLCTMRLIAADGQVLHTRVEPVAESPN